VASPPRVSSFSIHCLDFQTSVYGNLPKALYSEDDLVLFRVPIVTISHGDDIDSEDNHYFVYQAGTKNTPPSLHLLPIPHHLEFNDREAVLLRCRDQDMFYLALLVRVFHVKYHDKQYDLHLYNSKTRTWSTKLTHIDYSYSPKEEVTPVQWAGSTSGGASLSVTFSWTTIFFATSHYYRCHWCPS
jgi:hypothetical protein